MPGTTAQSQRPLTEQIDELRKKILLLEGDRKAYYETSQYCMKQNRDKIASLRKETSELRKRRSDRLKQDQHVVDRALNDKPVMRAALSSKTGREAIIIYDHKVSDSMKRLNALRHQTALKQKRLEEVQTQYNLMVKDSEDAVATDKGDSHDAQTMRYLENSYDKVVMKCEEAKQVKRVYCEIKSKFAEEAQSYPTRLDKMEQDIAKTKAELKDLKAMRNDAEQAKQSSQEELSKQEEVVYGDRKKREIELQKMKKEAEEKKMQHDKIEKRLAQRGSLQGDELTGQEKMLTVTGEEQQQKITTYEEAFRRIKEATGVNDTMEVVERFQSQDQTTQHLEDLKKENEKTILRLRDEKERLNMEFEEMKYSGEAKLSSGQMMLEEFEAHLLKEETRRDEGSEKLQRASRILVQVKAGVEHLADKLYHLKASKGHVPTAQINASSDEYVLDQLSTSEEKLLKLLEELDGKDLNEIIKQMEDEEYHTSEVKLPAYNTRINLPQTQRDLVYEDDDDSGEDDGDVPTRLTIKKQSQSIVDSKTKRRISKKKKKTK